MESILSRQEPERNRSNKLHDASTVIRTFIVLNMTKTTTMRGFTAFKKNEIINELIAC